MMRKKYIFSVIAVFVGLFSATIAFAAFNDVQFSENSTFQLGNSKSYTFMSDTLVEAITIGDTSFDITVRDASYIRIRSSDRQQYTVTGSSCQSPKTTCESGHSELIIDCTNGPSQHTLTVKPEGSCPSTSSGGGGGGGGALFSNPGGGGGSAFTFDPKADKKKTEVKKEEPKPEVKKEEIKTPTTLLACALTPGKAYKASGNKSVYYITNACTKRAFKSAKLFFTYFSSWNDVQSTTPATLASVPNDTLGFMPYGPLYDPQYGALVKIVSDPKVYLLLGGKKHWITEENVFTSLKYAWNWVEDVADELLNKYESAGEITEVKKHPNFTLVKYASSPKVYRLEPKADDSQATVKRHIKDEAAFKALNFRWDRIVLIDPTEVYADGLELIGPASSDNTKAATKTTVTAPAPAVPATSASVKYVFTSLLSQGSSGDEVKELQKLLKKLGFFPADVELTGLYGPTTVKAVADFQKAKGVDPVGYVGAKTRAALNAVQ